MKKIILSILVIYFFVGLPLFVFSAPMPTGIAINEKTNECYMYSGGDERVIISLKENFKAYYPTRKFEETADSRKAKIISQIIETPKGTCEVPPGNSMENMEKCCSIIGMNIIKETLDNATRTNVENFDPRLRADNYSKTKIWLTMILVAVPLFSVVFVVIKNIHKNVKGNNKN